MFAWNLKTTVDAYNKAGAKSIIWDDPARKCLTAFAHARAHDLPSENWDESVSTNAAAAVNAGCTDPLITYLYIRYVMPQTNSKVEFEKRFHETADAMNASSYPNVRKFYATARALEQCYYTFDTQKDLKARDEAFGFLSDVYTLTGMVLDDKTIPIQEASDVTDLAMNLGSRTDLHNKNMFYDRAEDTLMKNFPNTYLPWYLKGSHYVDLAWTARGSGYADTVTADGWEGFKTNMVIAREALEHAWKLNPKNPNIPTQMMSVNLGQGGGREEMELWFNRAMELNTNNYNACFSKENFLEPKWYGTDEEAVTFARQCVQSTKWGGHVPLTLVLAHNDIDSRLQGAAKADYWKRPEVWADIKSAYDRFLELNPGQEEFIWDSYVLHAYQAEQWDALNELLPKLTRTNYDTFGGKSEFEKMLRLAKTHASN